jgi:hypothetical protein
MAKGLCKRCGKKWHRGHKCSAAVQLNVMQELWDILDLEVADSGSTSLDEHQQEQLFMVLSESAISGSEAPRTLKIRGHIQQLAILVPIDSGSSNSFISSQVAKKLEGVTHSSKPTRV